ncbi:hypothetical protein MD484_g3194, partial [Candolleomyces efflorescens]
MSTPCRECGGPTVWDDAAASEICTSCGSLADAAQVVLTSQDYYSELGLHHELRVPAPNILKSRSNYTLAGQGQAVRDQKNALTMANFIKSLAVSMNVPGLTPRATTLFSQAKAVNFFRWGSRARVVAGACLSLALRESNRPDSIPDIATLLKCSPHLLSRTFISLISALKITTVPVDPSVYIGTLQTYLTSILQENAMGCNLPAPLLTFLRQVSIRAVANTALSLGRILSRTCPQTGSSKPSAASTACAIFMLSFEAESRDTLSSLAELATCLAGRCHIGKGVVMTQYKSIQDQVTILIEKVPWLDKYEQKKGRAKVSKRLVVARGLKDVISFNEEILQKTLLPVIHLDLTGDEITEDLKLNSFEEKKENEEDPEPEQDSYPCSEPDTACGSGNDKRPSKRRKLHHSLDEASHFLLNPFNAPQLPCSGQRKSALSNFALTSYVLSTSSLASVGRKPPTRLQLLATARGGSGEDVIYDDELFAEGEIEGLLRNDEEIKMMKHLFSWGNDEDEDSPPRSDAPMTTRKTKAMRQGDHQDAGPRKTSRINMEAFATFMQESEGDSIGGEKEDDEEDQSYSLLGLDGMLTDDGPVDYQSADEDAQEADHHATPRAPFNSRATSVGAEKDLEAGETILDAWRPPSPSGGVSLDNRYEEEYD